MSDLEVHCFPGIYIPDRFYSFLDFRYASGSVAQSAQNFWGDQNILGSQNVWF